jgi:hypothetical protein
MLMLLVLLRRASRREQFVSNSPNIRHWLGVAVIACLAPALFGQTLRLSSASASRGDQITIELSLESLAGKEPLALQWETNFPVRMVSPIDEKGFKEGAAQGAGKSLNCAVKEKGPDNYLSRCVLAGGQKPIPNGPVGMLRLKIPMDAPLGSAHIRVANATAVSKDSKAVSLVPVETTVTVRK